MNAKYRMVWRAPSARETVTMLTLACHGRAPRLGSSRLQGR